MLTIRIKQGRGGRWRWFAVNSDGRTAYSCFPNSFDYEQSAWEHAEWACGASVTMRYGDPLDPDTGMGFENFAGAREFND